MDDWMNIDYRLMLKQDPELKKYFEGIILEVMLRDNHFKELATAIVSFYNMGMSKDQVVKFIIGLNKASR